MKPCPFCDWRPDLITKDGLDSSETFVYCSMCFSRGRSVTWIGDKAAAESTAIEAWNQRASSLGLEEREALEAARQNERRYFVLRNSVLQAPMSAGFTMLTNEADIDAQCDQILLRKLAERK